MRYSNEVIEDIRLGNDIIDVISSYVTLKPTGNSYVGLCPFHKESTPSLSVSPDKQLYNCFGCGAAGTIFNFIMSIENYDFIDTIKFLADRINYQLPELNSDNFNYSNELQLKNKLYEIHKIVAKKYYENLISEQGAIAREYLDKREISPQIRIKYGLGYSLNKRDDVYNILKENNFSKDEILESGLVLKDSNGNFYDRFFGRLMFPIIDVQNRVVGFGGRELTGKKNTPKYLNSPDTKIFNKSYNLYSINLARHSKTKEFILVEGYMDVIALYQIGIKNVIASLGTAFNENHARALKKYANKAIILFDSDEAGTNATIRAIPILVKNGISTKVLQVFDAKDPDEYIKKFGDKSFIQLLNKAQPYVSFEIQQKLKQYNIKDLNQKVEFTKEVAKIISKLNNDIEKEVFIKEASVITNISYDSIYSEIKKLSEIEVENSFKNEYNINKSNININNVNKINNAKEGLLYILATNINTYDILKNYISPEQFSDEFYTKLAKIIFEYNENNKNIYPAEIVNKFEDEKVQQKVAKVFMQKFNFSESEHLEKVVNDYFKIIKTEYLELEIKKIISSNDLTNLNELFKEKSQLEKIYIKL